jgi:hypothetical protein
MPGPLTWLGCRLTGVGSRLVHLRPEPAPPATRSRRALRWCASTPSRSRRSASRRWARASSASSAAKASAWRSGGRRRRRQADQVRRHRSPLRVVCPTGITQGPMGWRRGAFELLLAAEDVESDRPPDRRRVCVAYAPSEDERAGADSGRPPRLGSVRKRALTLASTISVVLAPAAEARTATIPPNDSWTVKPRVLVRGLFAGGGATGLPLSKQGAAALSRGGAPVLPLRHGHRFEPEQGPQPEARRRGSRTGCPRA